MSDSYSASAAAAARRFKIVAGADDFGAPLKDAVVAHLRSVGVEVEDLPTNAYYSAAAEVARRVSASPADTRGLLACGTGTGVSIAANKFPAVSAATCLSAADAANARSINNCNVLALSGLSTPPSAAVEIVETWLDTPFKSPCPASGDRPWPEDIQSFLDNSMTEIPKIAGDAESGCSICCLIKGREFGPIDVMPGGSMKILRETPTSAFVRFKAGSVEPAHHHTFGHDLVVLEGKKTVWNLTKKERFDLTVGDFLFTPAGDVHRVRYIEDTEFFIKWDGHWDLLFDEDLETARKVIAEDEAKIGPK